VGIVLMSALGDVTLGLPVAMAIRRAHPTVHLTWIVQRGPDALLHGHPAVDELVHFDRRGGIGAYRDVARRLAQRPFDVLLDLQVAIKAGLVTRLARAAEKWGIDRGRSRDGNWLFTTHHVPPRPRRHMADQFLEFLAPLGIAAEPVAYGLSPTAAARDAAGAYVAEAASRELVAVVVASSAAMKNWDATRLGAACVALVRDFGLLPVLCGGPSDAEREAAAEILRVARASLAPSDLPVDALGSGIPNLLGILERAALVISPDTGPLHMAVALRRPVIGLYGATNPLWVGPYRWCPSLVVDAWHDPGEPRHSSRAKRPGRMARITVEQVLEKVAAWRAGAPLEAPAAAPLEGLMEAPRGSAPAPVSGR
jgi:heptosyltransferase I